MLSIAGREKRGEKGMATNKWQQRVYLVISPKIDEFANSLLVEWNLSIYPFPTSFLQSAPNLQMVEYTVPENDECLCHLLLLPWSQLIMFRISRIWILMPTVHSLLCTRVQASSLVHCELTINDNSINIPPYQKHTLQRDTHMV